MTIQLDHNNVETSEAIRSPHYLANELTDGCASSKLDDIADIDTREDRLFRAMDDDNDLAVLAVDLESTLVRIGLSRNDERLRESLAAIRVFTTPDFETEEVSGKMDRTEFCQAIRHSILLIEKVLQGRMVIPDFSGFSRDIKKIFNEVKKNSAGKPANYIPQLDVEGEAADRFAVSICTVDGQRFSLGDSQHFFTVQSTSKPISYALALEEHGSEYVHRFIGHEPSGFGFNELALDKYKRPHNPMINAGAIMSAALIGLKDKKQLMRESSSLNLRGWAGKRFEHVVDRWRALCGNVSPRFSTSVFLSERETADRNYALAYFMREAGAFPDDTDIHDNLEFYLQCCSIELNTEMMSTVASTFANGGICPVTGERIFSTDTVRNCLSQMSGCGMYDFSGEFAFTVGLPAKSGVSGATMIVIPNVMGICIWSPKLDEIGNSVRGIAFCRELVKHFNFHNYDDLTGSSAKKDPRLNPIHTRARLINEMVWAASKGDVGALHDQLRRGGQLHCADYDHRTPLHLAATENQIQVVRFFIEEAKNSSGDFHLSPEDRWGHTPLDDAYLYGRKEIIAMLENEGAKRGNVTVKKLSDENLRRKPSHTKTFYVDELIWAASLGDLGAVRRLVARGVPLDMVDYDYRTALHLAAAEGHINVVRYFLAHGVPTSPRDRWGGTPLDGALKQGHDEIVKMLS